MNPAEESSLLRAELSAFLDEVDRAAVVDRIVEQTGADAVDVRRRLDTYLNEAFVGLELIAPHLSGTVDILEIGAGVGALSMFLSGQGYRVVAVEPVGTGFDFVGHARRALSSEWNSEPPTLLPIDAAELGSADGDFDLAFSVHVLEHVASAADVIAAVQQRVRSSGVSIHLCPNYSVPYEPHFGVPLVPIRPAFTRHLLPQRISESDLWSSLNFITARHVSRLAREIGVDVVFERGVMASAADRVGTDDAFRQRQGLAGRVAAWVVGRSLGRTLLGAWPPRLATPMKFTMSAASADLGLDVHQTATRRGR